MIPWVTVPSRPKGLPTAMTKFPTLSFEESPSLTTGRFLASILITATSLFGSAPMSLAENTRSSASRTSTTSASPTTWLLVTM